MLGDIIGDDYTINFIIGLSPYVFATGAAVAGLTFAIKSGTGQVADSVRFAKTAFFAVLKFTFGITSGAIIGVVLARYLVESACNCSSTGQTQPRLWDSYNYVQGNL